MDNEEEVNHLDLLTEINATLMSLARLHERLGALDTAPARHQPPPLSVRLPRDHHHSPAAKRQNRSINHHSATANPLTEREEHSTATAHAPQSLPTLNQLSARLTAAIETLATTRTHINNNNNNNPATTMPTRRCTHVSTAHALRAEEKAEDDANALEAHGLQDLGSLSYEGKLELIEDLQTILEGLKAQWMASSTEGRDRVKEAIMEVVRLAMKINDGGMVGVKGLVGVEGSAFVLMGPWVLDVSGFG